MTRALSHHLRIPAAVLALGTALAAVGVIGAPDAAHAATIMVDTFADTVDAGCTGAPLPGADGSVSLREAVCVANANPDADVIELDAGTYELDFYLEVTTDIRIVGAGIDATTIDAGGTDRVIDAWAFAPTTLGLYDLTLQGGDVRGAGIPEGGVLNLFMVDTHLERVRVTGGIAERGGGIANIYGQLTLLDSEVIGNEASTVDGTSRGGGIWSVGNSTLVTTFRMQRTTVSGNTVVGNGGGIVLELGNDDNATIEQSTISGNTARFGTDDGGYGGGLSFDFLHNGSLVVTDSTISGNTAERGGAIYHHAGFTSSLLLSNATVVGNTANETGGIDWNGVGFVTVNSSIVAGNTADVDPDLYGNTTGSDNLIGVAGAGFVDGVDGNRVGSAVAPLDALLGPLADNGGPTQTHLPLAGSPVIDVSASSCGAIDQRGVTRPQGTACDIGAVELSTTETTIMSGPDPDSAMTSAIFAVMASGVIAPVSLECALDGAAFAPCVSPVAFGSLAEGAHTILIRAVDGVGGTDATPATYSWTVDTTGPTVAWGAVAVGATDGETSSFAFTATDALSAVAFAECSLDGATFSMCVSPVTTVGLGEGSHSFRVRALDVRGNRGPAVEQLWTVVAAPTVVDPVADPDAEKLVMTGGDAVPGTVTAAVLLALGALLLLVRRRMVLSRN